MNDDRIEVSLDELSAEDAFELAMCKIEACLDTIPKMSPRESVGELLELLNETLLLLEHYAETIEYERSELNFDTTDMRMN